MKDGVNLIGVHRPLPIIKLKYWFDNDKIPGTKTLVTFTDAGFCKEIEIFCEINNIKIFKKGYLKKIIYCYLG